MIPGAVSFTNNKIYSSFDEVLQAAQKFCDQK
jgi:hypothetical protein